MAFARYDDPETSHEAAENIDTTRLEKLVYDVIRQNTKPDGMCVVEIHQKLPYLSIDCISPRMKRLVEKKLIRCLGKAPRANRHGKVRNQLIYEPVEKSEEIKLEKTA